MSNHLPQQLFGRLWRAILEFDMLAEGDRVLIGLSGGKDSIFLTYALSILRRHLPFSLEVAAFTVDPMFGEELPTDRLEEFCSRLDIPFYTDRVNIAKAIASGGQNDPCFTCAFFRRGAVNRFASEHGYNKVALAHHHDDAVETLLMSILHSGQIRTFLPVTYLDRSQLTVIRPLIYFREKDLKNAVKIHGFAPVKNPCPFDGHTMRQEVKELIRDLTHKHKGVYAHLASAMRTDAVIELWPEELSRPQMKEKYLCFWKKEG